MIGRRANALFDEPSRVYSLDVKYSMILLKAHNTKHFIQHNKERYEAIKVANHYTKGYDCTKSTNYRIIYGAN